MLGRHRTATVAEAYLEAIHRLGGEPFVVWPGAQDTSLLSMADGALLIGGGDVAPERFGSDAAGDAVDPGRDGLETAIVTACRTQGLPLLGMCRGAQAVNVALGGSLREVPGHRQEGPLAQPAHTVEVEPGTRLGELVGRRELKVNSYHRWAVDRPGAGLLVAARSGDVIEGVESDGPWWCVGVQWHAELLDEDHARAPFEGLLAAARGGT